MTGIHGAGKRARLRRLSPFSWVRRWAVLFGLILTTGWPGPGGADLGSELERSTTELTGESHVFLVVDGRGVAEAENPSLSTVGAGGHVWAAAVEPASGAFSGASGGAYRQALPDTGTSGPPRDPFLYYSFEVSTAADYVSYIRASGPDGRGNSAYVAITDSSGVVLSSQTLFSINSSGSWGWYAAASAHLPAGRYAVRVAYRESGVSVDKIVLQDAGLPAPIGVGEPETGLVGENWFVVSDGVGAAEAELYTDIEADSSEPIHQWSEAASPATGAFSGAEAGFYMHLTPDIGIGGVGADAPWLSYEFRIPEAAGVPNYTVLNCIQN